MAKPQSGAYRDTSHPIYEELQRSPEFQDLRKRYRGFAIPWTIAFLVWYMTYVFMSNWAHDFMSTKVIGNINIALIFGLLQFASTFLIAWMYGRYMNKHTDPLARELDRRYNDATGEAQR